MILNTWMGFWKPGQKRFIEVDALALIVVYFGSLWLLYIRG
jgi:hypothetical protein